MSSSVGHVMREYLPRSQTFVHTTLRFQTHVRPVVLAGRVTHAGEFPFAPVVELTPPAGLAVRAVRRARAHLAGVESTLEHQLIRRAREHGCDLLHVHWGHIAWKCLAARRRLAIPMVATFYGYDVGLGRTDAAWRQRYQRLFAEAAAVCVEGPAMASQLQSLGCPSEKLRLVRIPIDLSLFPYAPPERWGTLLLTQTGRMVDKKGFDTALRTFARARPALGEAQLQLVGDGPLRPSLEALARDLGVAERVRFLGSLSHADYRAVLAGTHVALQTSRTAADGDTEGGAPTVLIELQAAGVPVVATRHADIPWIVASEDLLADEDDVDGLAAALVRAAGETDAERRARTEQGRAFVEAHHDAGRLAAALVQVYESVLAAT